MSARNRARTLEKKPEAAVDAESTVVYVGNRIRTLRMERKMTLQALAAATGLSSSMLSLVERGKTSPSIGTLVAISSALGIHMSDLFEEVKEPIEEPVVRLEDQPVYVTAQGVKRRVAKTDDEHGVEVVINEYEPETGSGREPIHHAGYEYAIVLEGKLEVEVDGIVYELKPGDCISYESTLPHRIVNRGRKHVRAVWVNLNA